MRALRRKKERAASGLFLVEGLRHVGEAAAFGAVIDYVVHTPGLLAGSYAQELLHKLEDLHVEVLIADEDVFASVADKDAQDGIIAVVRQHTRPLAELNAENAPFVCAVARPQDPGNLGALLRTADAAGAAGLIALGDGVDPFHPTAARASMGTLFRLPPALAALDDFGAWAQREGYHVYGSSASGAVDYRGVDYRLPAVLLLGSEREGLNAAERALCETLVRLPMRGAATSLNLSVAGGILLYALAEHFRPSG